MNSFAFTSHYLNSNCSVSVASLSSFQILMSFDVLDIIWAHMIESKCVFTATCRYTNTEEEGATDRTKNWHDKRDL